MPLAEPFAPAPPLYLQRVPAPPLNLFIASLWFCRRPPEPLRLERVLPNASPQIIFNLNEDRTRTYLPEAGFRCQTTSSGAVFSGLRPRYSIIDTLEQEHAAGIAFRPGGPLAFFPLPAHELPAADVPLSLLWGRAASELRDRLLAALTPTALLDTLEAFLAARCLLFHPHPAVALAFDAFARPDGAPAVSAVASLAGLSPKRFIERFKAAAGLPPKQYCRILRFRRVLHLAASGRPLDWTRIALDCGYFDQPHFIHDFRAFSGITPTAYGAARTQFLSHVKFLQSNSPVS